ncbi:hypothetical protein DS831_06060 [Bombilactobacillus bombi]|uniref:Uncharacterized protein n=1 Tax=Bombilactobacillus bombi TaxID=1303590 RepID=A0A3R6UXG6_9LACO|nr:hypothetical protein [Bombilactobacillus bombi]RHW49724.1 hypothetical protein DS831_06060 [Bombilactobacillus bombi]
MSEHLGFYLTNKNNETIELPVNPAEVMLKCETDDKSETIVSFGEINRIGEAKFKSVSIQSTFPTDLEAHYISANDLLGKPQAYIDWIISAHKSHKPIRFLVSSTKITLEMTISSFEYGMKSGYDGEYQYTLDLKEYRPVEVKQINSVQKNTNSMAARPSPPKKIGLGSIVIVNGQLHRDSYGNGPGQYEQNARRKISFVELNKAYPYHVSTLDGGWRGWVRQSEVRLE